MPVFFVTETGSGHKLNREFHSVALGGTDPASAAITAMFAEPVDPDYSTPWPAGSALHRPVEHRPGEIVVDLTGIGSRPEGGIPAKYAMQQLVFTAQEALRSTDPVRLLVDGAPVPALWGTVDATVPVTRGDPYSMRTLVQIDSPAHGVATGREIEVTGEAAVFEANVLWEVLRDGRVVTSGHASTAEGQRFSPFSFTLSLSPGDYTVRIREDDVSDEGRSVLSDDKDITVS